MMAAEERVSLTGRLILVVEDDPFIALDLQDMLGGRGAEVLGPAPTIGAALAALAERRPDAALLDVNLRGVISAPVAQALSVAGVPFLVLTGYSRDQLDDAVLREATILAKPVMPDELLRLLGRILSGEAA